MPPASLETHSLAIDADVPTENKDACSEGSAFSVVSHELRTPVTCIGGYVALLLDEYVVDLGGSTGHYLEVVERNCARLLHSVRDLRFLADLDGGRLRWDVERVNVPALVARALGAARPRAERAAVELRAVTPPCAPWSGDPERLAHLLDNLISNAVKFTRPGGAVRVTLRPGPASFRLEVEDEGEGIGLTVAAEIARAHGGRIDLATDAGGTTVRVDLPLAAP